MKDNAQGLNHCLAKCLSSLQANIRAFFIFVASVRCRRAIHRRLKETWYYYKAWTRPGLESKSAEQIGCKKKQLTSSDSRVVRSWRRSHRSATAWGHTGCQGWPGAAAGTSTASCRCRKFGQSMPGKKFERTLHYKWKSPAVKTILSCKIIS